MWFLVVGGGQGEGHGQVGERVGGQQQGEAAEVQFVDAERAAEVLQDRAAVRGHVKPPGMVVEHVVDEPRGKVQEELAAERVQGPFDAHAVLEHAVEHQVADLVVVEGPGEDSLWGVAEGLATVTAGSILAAGDLQNGDGLVGDGAYLAWECPLAPAELTALRAGGLLGGAVDRYNDGCGSFGAHACVLGEEAVFNLIPRDASPILQEQNGLHQAHPSVVFGEKSRYVRRAFRAFWPRSVACCRSTNDVLIVRLHTDAFSAWSAACWLPSTTFRWIATTRSFSRSLWTVA